MKLVMLSSSATAFWLEIAKIFVPSLTALAVGFWVARKVENHKNALSRELEDYKKGITKEIESYRFQLQTQFYAFQTKYSLLHQREAEAILNLYQLITEISSKFALMRTYFRNSALAPEKAKTRLLVTGKTISAHFAETESKCQEFNQNFRKSRILLDEETCERSLEIINLLVNCMNRFEEMLKNESRAPQTQNADALQIEAWLENLSNVEKLLRAKFRLLLAAENDSQKLAMTGEKLTK